MDHGHNNVAAGNKFFTVTIQNPVGKDVTFTIITGRHIKENGVTRNPLLEAMDISSREVGFKMLTKR